MCLFYVPSMDISYRNYQNRSVDDIMLVTLNIAASHPSARVQMGAILTIFGGQFRNHNFFSWTGYKTSFQTMEKLRQIKI